MRTSMRFAWARGSPSPLPGPTPTSFTTTPAPVRSRVETEPMVMGRPSCWESFAACSCALLVRIESSTNSPTATTAISAPSTTAVTIGHLFFGDGDASMAAKGTSARWRCQVSRREGDTERTIARRGQPCAGTRSVPASWPQAPPTDWPCGSRSSARTPRYASLRWG